MSVIPDNLVGLINTLFPVQNSNFLNIHADPNNPQCSYIVCPTRCNIKITYPGLINLKIKNIRLENSTQEGNIVRRFVWIEVDDNDSKMNMVETNFTSNVGMPQVQSEENRYYLKYILMSIPSLDYLDSELYDGEIKFIHESVYKIQGETRKVILSILMSKDLQQYQNLSETPKSFSFFNQFVDDKKEMIIPASFQTESKSVQFNPSQRFDLVSAIPRKINHHDLIDMTYYTVQKTPSVVLFVFEKAIPIQAEFFNLLKRRLFTTDTTFDNYIKKRKDGPTNCPFNQFFYSDETDNIYASQLRGNQGEKEDKNKVNEKLIGYMYGNPTVTEKPIIKVDNVSSVDNASASVDNSSDGKEVKGGEDGEISSEDERFGEVISWISLSLCIILVVSIIFVYYNEIKIGFNWFYGLIQKKRPITPQSDLSSLVTEPNLEGNKFFNKIKKISTPEYSSTENISGVSELAKKGTNKHFANQKMGEISKIEVKPSELGVLGENKKMGDINSNLARVDIPDYSAGTYLQKLEALGKKTGNIKRGSKADLGKINAEIVKLNNQSEHWLKELGEKSKGDISQVESKLDTAVKNLEKIRNNISTHNNSVPKSLQNALDTQRQKMLGAMRDMTLYSRL